MDKRGIVRELTLEELNIVTGGNGANPTDPLTGFGVDTSHARPLTEIDTNTQETGAESNQMRPRTGMFGGG